MFLNTYLNRVFLIILLPSYDLLFPFLFIHTCYHENPQAYEEAIDVYGHAAVLLISSNRS